MVGKSGSPSKSSGMSRTTLLVIAAVLAAVVVYVIVRRREKFLRLEALDSGACELTTDCRWDTGRTCVMSSGLSGVCTLGGKCCPSFSLDQTRELLEVGRSPEMVDELYAARLGL
jgi:hypothetical protein